jgi:hypothetical protein
VVEELIALVVGLAAGAHTATWGMYKDAPYEGFTYRKYFRSIVLSAAIALIVAPLTDLDMHDASAMVILFGLTYVIERGINEFYKTFLREEDQSKYSIPMQFAIRGLVVEQRRVRWLAAGAYVIGVAAVVGGIYALQELDLCVDGLVVVLVIGSLGGWISAFGGAWKDAPHEGFQPFKFVRSPLVALGYALLIAGLTHSYVFIAMGALGYTVATLETHKTFFKPNTPRGKFAGKEIRYPEMLVYRRRFVPLYAAIWVAIVIAFTAAYAAPHSGLLS